MIDLYPHQHIGDLINDSLILKIKEDIVSKLPYLNIDEIDVSFPNLNERDCRTIQISFIVSSEKKEKLDKDLFDVEPLNKLSLKIESIK